MPQVAVSKVSDEEKKALPIFDEIKKRIEGVQQRAFELFESRGREFGRHLEDWLRAERELLGWPAAELADQDNAYVLSVTLPGFEAKEVEVTVTSTEIIVHAIKQEEKTSGKGHVVWTEFGSNDVYRRFELPKPISVEATTASLEKGLLRVKAPQAVVKPMAVKVAAA